jgi:excisionase family DNA binding protein
MKTDADALVIDVVEAGRRLGLGRSAAYQAVHAGQIPSVRIGGLIKVPVGGAPAHARPGRAGHYRGTAAWRWAL